MAANSYKVEDLLIGKHYCSDTTQGEIVTAEKHPSAVWYQDAEAYLVEIHKPDGGYVWRTVAVSV